MPVILASRTLTAIATAIEADQGNAFRAWQGRVLPHMHDAYKHEDGAFRSHLGASMIGRECARELWYGFRWATKRTHSAQMLRLFNRGHLEEGRFIAMLLTIGCQVHQQDANGKQYRISDAGGHYGGSGDGVFVGCPDLPAGTPALSEFKTHNAKSFAALAGANWREVHDGLLRGEPATKFKGEGVRLGKLEHYVQMQQYMLKMNLTHGVYFAANKDTDDIYAEVVPLDAETGARYLERGRTIVFMRNAPERLSKSPGWFACKFCDHKMVCHYGAAPERNCRTCAYSEPREDGTWWCENKERQLTMLFGPKPGISDEGETFQLSKQRQLSACSMWEKHATAFT